MIARVTLGARGAALALLLALMLLPLSCGMPDKELPSDRQGPEGAGPGSPPPPGGGGGMIQRFDKDGDGKLTADEVPEPARGRVMEADANGDGVITADELAQGHARMRQGGPHGPGGPGGPNGAHLMQRYDADKDGMLSPDEIPVTMRQRLSPADLNGDGMISEGELSEAHEQMGGRGPGHGRGMGRRGGRRGPRSFEGLDKNADGFLSPEEIPEPMRNEFMAADLDGDGKISRAEADSQQRPPAPPQ